MRRVWTSRGVLLPLLLALAVSFVFIGRGGHIAEASPFNPTITTSLSSSAAGATADINQFANWGTSPVDGSRSFPASSVYFTPGNWGIPDCSPQTGCPSPLGERTGNFSSTTTFGLLNSQCAIAIPVGFPNGMRNASTDRNDPGTLSPGPGFANLNNTAGDDPTVQDGAEHWNTLLAGLVSAGILPNADPRERQILSTVALGTPVWVDVLTYDPGLLGGPASAPLGYGTTFILENANPLNPPAPSLITDTCGLSNNITQSGLSSPGGFAHRSNPATAGSSVFFLNAGSQRDADQGPSAPAEPTTYVLPGGLSGSGFVNSLDTCPFQPNIGGPIAPAGAPFNGDSSESPGDGIDEACDPTPTVFSGSDMDADAYLNRGDNCVQDANGITAGPNNQQDLSEVAGPGAADEVGQQPVDGGPASDSIGDVCDLGLHAVVPDGHFHSALKLAPVCVGTTDTDGDGWCDGTEAALGSNPAMAASTPEALAVPGSCSDGADNDGDGSTDLNDTGCQLPSHDLSIKKLNQVTTVVPCAGGTANFNLLINNSPAGAADNAEIGIYLDSQPSYVPGTGAAQRTAPDSKSAGSVVAGSVAGATVTQSGMINVDGDSDVEWLTKAVVSVKHSPATTTVQFSVNFPASSCTSGPDFMLTVDLCHGNDIAPLGVAPLNGNCAGAASSDGGQDRNSANDIVTKSIDAQ
ncbi:MAG: hypothetical protein E6I38_13330 [Chloroflexi bacterium]|nr:MAG: hypothetical protein E6I38_13330 [Chloroflexota bacterium]